jgi:Flp pilus assembly pilin Flp
MQKLWIRFRREVDGQDLLEYTFLLAAILLASVALMMNISPGANAIWAQTGVTLDQAGGGPAAAGSRVPDRSLPADAIKGDALKKASPAGGAFSTPEMVVAGATVAVLSWLLWYAESSGPARSDQLPMPQSKKLAEATVAWRRRPTDYDGPLVS